MFEYAFAERALAAALIVGLLCGRLGVCGITRRRALIGVGLTQDASGGGAIGARRGGGARVGGEESRGGGGE